MATPIAVVAGAHRVAAVCSGRPVALALASGIRAHVCEAERGPAELAIASERLAARDVDDAFIPLGPTFMVTAPALRVPVSYAVERYTVRAEHRLVLVVVTPGSRRVLAAEQAGQRFTARASGVGRARLQFGLLPEALAERWLEVPSEGARAPGAGPAHSAAP